VLAAARNQGPKAREQSMILRPIKGIRTDSLESLAMNHVLVVVLNAEILPLDYARAAFDRKADRAAADGAAFRTDTQRRAMVREVRGHPATKAFNRRKLLHDREPSKGRDKVRIEPRAQRDAVDDKVEVAPFGTAPTASARRPGHIEARHHALLRWLTPSSLATAPGETWNHDFTLCRRSPVQLLVRRSWLPE